MKRYHHEISYVIRNFFRQKSVKTVILLLALECMLFVFVISKGLGVHYLPIMGISVFFTVISCGLAFWAKADEKLLVIILLLLNLGFIVQEVSSGTGIEVSGFLFKFTVAMAAGIISAFLYRYFSDFLADDAVVLGLMAVQILLCAVLFFCGIKVGNIQQQGAVLMVRLGPISFTPFEVVKLLYLFSSAALLCKKSKNIYLRQWVVKRELMFVLHTALLSGFAFLCRELGTFLIIYMTGLGMFWIFGRNRKWVLFLVVITLIIGVGIWVICDVFLYPLIRSGEIQVPGMVEKLVKRFGTALHPEREISGSGYQGTLALEALTIGGWLGIGTERHRIAIPEASSDMIFANVVQTCGFLVGAVILIAFLALLKRGTEIALSRREPYIQGLAMTIILVLSMEGIVHIGYNIGILPITGIPLYFVSQGFTAMVTGMVLAAILLVLSSRAWERKEA